MDRVVKVRRSFLNEIRAFCNCFASACESCYRVTCDCPMADVIHRAKNLILMIDNVRDAEEERFFIENPSEEYLLKVETAIRQGGGKPVRSESIKIEGENRQRKARALKTLVKRHRIIRTVIGGFPFYTVNEDGVTTNTDKTNKEN